MAKYSLEHAKKMSKKWNKEVKRKVFSDPQTREIYERKHREIKIALRIKMKKKSLGQQLIAAIEEATHKPEKIKTIRPKINAASRPKEILKILHHKPK